MDQSILKPVPSPVAHDNYWNHSCQSVITDYSISNPNLSSGEHNNYWYQRYRLSKCFDEKIKINLGFTYVVLHRY